MTSPTLSFVIPLYRSAETIGAVVREIEALAVEGGHEIVLVNDGSPDNTSEVARALAAAVDALGGEHRDGQVAMAEAVAASLNDSSAVSGKRSRWDSTALSRYWHWSRW